MPDTPAPPAKRSLVSSFAFVCLLLGPLPVRSEMVEAEIKGILTRAGKPAAGVEVVSCRDAQHFAFQFELCKEPVRVFTDRFGRFAFVQVTGMSPPQAVGCTPKPGCALGDPGWRYGFKVRDGRFDRTFYRRGIGYGIALVRAECSLPATTAPGESLVCNVLDVPLEIPRRAQKVPETDGGGSR